VFSLRYELHVFIWLRYTSVFSLQSVYKGKQLKRKLGNEDKIFYGDGECFL
jgi:hypothetical protein